MVSFRSGGKWFKWCGCCLLVFSIDSGHQALLTIIAWSMTTLFFLSLKTHHHLNLNLLLSASATLLKLLKKLTSENLLKKL